MRAFEIKMTFPFDFDEIQIAAVATWLRDIAMQAYVIGAEVEVKVDGESYDPTAGGIN
jgi:hypothetical protein